MVWPPEWGSQLERDLVGDRHFCAPVLQPAHYSLSDYDPEAAFFSFSLLFSKFIWSRLNPDVQKSFTDDITDNLSTKPGFEAGHFNDLKGIATSSSSCCCSWQSVALNNFLYIFENNSVLATCLQSPLSRSFFFHSPLLIS